MKLNNLDDFTKNNWYITTTASTIIDTATTARQIKESSSSSSSLQPVAIQHQSIATQITSEQQQYQSLQVNDTHKSIDIIRRNSGGGTAGTATGSHIINNSCNIEEDFINNYQHHNNIIMPATTTDTKTTTTTTSRTQQSDVLAVEELVYEIKENLRLKARPTSQQNGRSSRPSPYHIPCRSWNDQQPPQTINININTDNHLNCNYINNKNNTLHYHHHHHNHHHKKEQDIDDPYELLQTLLKSKNLVKEAVRRLQLNNISSSSPKTAKKSYFYDSDDESRSPMFRMCQLEL